MGRTTRTPNKQPPLRLSTPLLMLWSLSQPARTDRDPPRMPRRDRIVSALTSMIVGAAIAMVVSVITPGSHGEIAKWMIVGGVAGMLIGVPLWSSTWRRHQRHPVTSTGVSDHGL